MSLEKTNLVTKVALNPQFVYPKRGWNWSFRSGWTKFCSSHSTCFQSVTYSCYSTYFQSVIFSWESMYCQSVIQINFSPYSYSTQKQRNRCKARWWKTKRERKRPMFHSARTIQTRKRAVTRKTKTKQRRKRPMQSRKRNGWIIKKECTLEAEILVDIDHGSTPFDIFQMVTGMKERLEIIFTETNRYAIQKGRNFSNNNSNNKTDKSYKIRPVMEHLNKVFAESLSNSLFQSVEEHVQV